MAGMDADHLAEAVMEALNRYAEETEDAMRESVTEVAKEAKDIVKNASPVRTGKYQKGWTTKKTEEKSGKLVVTLYNKNKGPLTHLLEHGHANRNGGRTPGKKHIALAEEYAEEELERQLERRLR